MVIRAENRIGLTALFGAASRISEAVPASKPETGRNFRRGRRPLKGVEGNPPHKRMQAVQNER